MEVNVNFFFTWLSMEVEIKKEEDRQRRMIEQAQRVKR